MAKQDKLSELRRLRAEGKTRRSLNFDEDDGTIYDEYDVREYEARRRAGLREDDFVVDDDGKGYVDNGAYEWDQPQPGSELESDGADSDSMTARSTSMNGRKKAHGNSSKRKQASAEPNKRDGDVTSLFSAPKKPKISSAAATTTTTTTTLPKPDTGVKNKVDAILAGVGRNAKNNAEVFIDSPTPRSSSGIRAPPPSSEPRVRSTSNDSGDINAGKLFGSSPGLGSGLGWNLRQGLGSLGRRGPGVAAAYGSGLQSTTRSKRSPTSVASFTDEAAGSADISDTPTRRGNFLSSSRAANSNNNNNNRHLESSVADASDSSFDATQMISMNPHGLGSVTTSSPHSRSAGFPSRMLGDGEGSDDEEAQELLAASRASQQLQAQYSGSQLPTPGGVGRVSTSSSGAASPSPFQNRIDIDNDEMHSDPPSDLPFETGNQSVDTTVSDTDMIVPTPAASSDANPDGFEDDNSAFASTHWNLVSESDFAFSSADNATTTTTTTTATTTSANVGGNKGSNATTAIKQGTILRLFWTDYYEKGGALILFGKTDRGTGASVVVRGVDRDLYLLPKPGKTTDDVAEEMSMFFSRNNVPSLRTMTTSLRNCFGEDKSVERDYLRVKAPYVSEPIPTKGNTYSHCYGIQTTPIETLLVTKQIMGPCWLDIKVNAVASNVSWTSTSVECSSPAHISVVPENESSTLGVPKFTMMSLAITTIPNAKQDHEVVSISVRLFRDVPDTVHDATNLPSTLITAIRPPDTYEGFPLGFKAAVKEHNASRRAKPKTVTSGAGAGTASAASEVLIMQPTEKALLQWFFSLLLRIDPDVLIGHSLMNVHLATLLARALATNETGWSKLGRFRQHSDIRRAGMQEVRRVCCGRLLVDLKNGFGIEIAGRLCREFTLEEMCSVFLNQHRLPFDTNIRSGDWLERGAVGLIDVVRRSEYDTLYVASIALKNQMLPLSRQLTQLAGNTWRATLFGTRSGRNDFLLMHEFSKNGLLIPDKPALGTNAFKHDNQYAGGQVFDPVTGLHQSCVLVMDFNSLYPSIIQEYNICFTTVDYDPEQTSEPEVPDPSVPQGLLPKLLQNLVRRRQEVKKLMKSSNATPEQLAEWDIRQMALKLTANSMYGCLGLPESRFGARPLAQLITMKGRQALVRTRDLAESNGMRVLYGDTDSVMIHTNASKYSDAYAIGLEFKRLVNQQYKTMEIDIDHIFRHLLLYMKKKYAAVILQPDGKMTLEYKGLDLRRREFSDVCRISSKQVLNLLFGLTGKNDYNQADSATAAPIKPEEDDLADPIEIFERVYGYLGTFAKEVREGKLFPRMFVIRNQLSRDLDKYPQLDKPQLRVAKARQDAGYTVKAKDVISYIIPKHNGNGDTSSSVTERAVSFEDLKKNNLEPDYEWYLHHQVYTPIARFCEKVEGFDGARLAEVMGLQLAEKLLKAAANAQLNAGSLFNGFEGLSLITLAPDADRFARCDRLKLRFRDEEEFEFSGLSGMQPQGIAVPNSNNSKILSYADVAVQVDAAIRSYIEQYYKGWMQCDECRNFTRSVGTFFGKKCPQPQCTGSLRVIYSSKDLYTQMCYFKSLFDTTRPLAANDRRISAIVNSPKNAEGLNMISSLVSRYIDRSGYSHINLGHFFVPSK